MRKFIQVRGCMGSGKTTVVRQFLNQYASEVRFIEIFGKQYPYTVIPELNIVISGRYDRAICGGIDGIIRNKNLMKEYIFALIKKLSPTAFIFEAVMYGITFKFTNDLYNMSQARGYSFTAIALVSAFDVNLQRIEARNGGKPIKVDAFEKQYSRYISSTLKLKDSGIPINIVKTDNIKFENMHNIIEEVIYDKKNS